MIRVYFVRHAQSEHPWGEDRTRPLSAEGKEDAKQVLEFFKDKQIDEFYSSPFKRSIDTIKETAEFFRQEIKLVEGFRERENGLAANTLTMIEKRWRDLNFHEEQGESISMVQKRNMAALKRILASLEHESLEKDLNIVIGTHGTALSSILHYYDSSFNGEAFLRIMDWTPYIISLDFDRGKVVQTKEHFYIEKASRLKK